MENLLTLKEAAARLRLSRHTLRSWVRQRRLPAVRLGRRALRFRAEDLDAVVNASHVPAVEGNGR